MPADAVLDVKVIHVNAMTTAHANVIANLALVCFLCWTCFNHIR